MGVPDLTPDFVKMYRELETERDGLRDELARWTSGARAEFSEVIPRPEPVGSGDLAVCRYELGIERDRVRKLEEENDQLRDELHRAESQRAKNTR